MTSEHASISVRLTPRAPVDELHAWDAALLQVRVRAAPVDGKANEALCRVVAAALGIAPGRVTLASGQRARNKRLRIEGLTDKEVARRLGLPGSG